MTQTAIKQPDVQQPVRNNGYSPPAKATTRVVSGGSLAEAVAGVGAVVLAILGFTGVVPVQLAAIAVIAIGGGFLLRGVTVTARAAAVMARNGREGPVGAGLGAELLAGVAGVALGVLALLGIQQAVLLPAALIVFGVALMPGAVMTRQLDSALGGLSEVSVPVLDTDLGAEVLVGLGAITLGIIALGLTPFNITLVLAALVAVGAGMTFEALPGLIRFVGVDR
jgi:hypothetical protein